MFEKQVILYIIYKQIYIIIQYIYIFVNNTIYILLNLTVENANSQSNAMNHLLLHTWLESY
jgi:hypothetical protein